MRSEFQANIRNTALVLLSGGIDSTACIEFYRSLNFYIKALFFEYGQLAAEPEKKASKLISQYYQIPLQVISCVGAYSKTPGVIDGRNAFLILGALLEFKELSGIIAVGIHSGTSYFDCSKEFIQTAQSIINGYTDGRIQIGTPFLEWTKPEIWKYCISRKVPLHLTYSCELGSNQPCGHCLSCGDLEALYACSKLNP